MGDFVNAADQCRGGRGAAVILTLNAVLLLQAFGVPIPGLPAG